MAYTNLSVTYISKHNAYNFHQTYYLGGGGIITKF